MRRKIMLGFVSLGSLLFLSGVISFFELAKLSKTTQNILDTSVMNTELSKDMLDAVQDQNTALLQIATMRNHAYDSSLVVARQNFEDAFAKVMAIHKNMPELDSIYQAKTRYNNVVNSVVSQSKDSVTINWFTNIYKTSYSDFTFSIKNFMVSTQHRMDRNTAQLESNAYRAIMPSIIALAVAIILVLIFFYFIDIYYIKPIVKMKSSLQNFLASKIPYNVTVNGNDEVFKLNEYIRELLLVLKNRKIES